MALSNSYKVLLERDRYRQELAAEMERQRMRAERMYWARRIAVWIILAVSGTLAIEKAMNKKIEFLEKPRNQIAKILKIKDQLQNQAKSMDPDTMLAKEGEISQVAATGRLASSNLDVNATEATRSPASSDRGGSGGGMSSSEEVSAGMNAIRSQAGGAGASEDEFDDVKDLMVRQDMAKQKLGKLDKLGFGEKRAMGIEKAQGDLAQQMASMDPEAFAAKAKESLDASSMQEPIETSKANLPSENKLAQVVEPGKEMKSEVTPHGLVVQKVSHPNYNENSVPPYLHEDFYNMSFLKEAPSKGDYIAANIQQQQLVEEASATVGRGFASTSGEYRAANAQEIERETSAKVISPQTYNQLAVLPERYIGEGI